MSVSWSIPIVTMTVAPSIFALPLTNPNKQTQHDLLHDTPRPLNPKPTPAPSRFASPNRFELLSDPDFPPPAPVESPKPSPHSPQVLSISSWVDLHIAQHWLGQQHEGRFQRPTCPNRGNGSPRQARRKTQIGLFFWPELVWGLKKKIRKTVSRVRDKG